MKTPKRHQAKHF